MIFNCQWLVSSLPCQLAEDEVHIWCAYLERSPSEIIEFTSILSEAEKAKANRFHFQRDRHHFIAARAILKNIISNYLDIPPETINFVYGKYGKPALSHPLDHLKFNVSHSKSLALYAISYHREVGIDIEFMRPMQDADNLAKRFFSQREYEIIKSLEDNIKQQAFFNAWTRKEAFIKAIGEGLAFNLNAVEVSLMPGETAALLNIPDNQQNHNWSLFELKPHSNYVAALVAAGNNLRLNCWQW